jgi:hypothetical protein
MDNKLNPKLRFKAEIEDEIPRIEFDIDPKPKKKSRVIIQKKKDERKTRDSSTNNTRLF